MVKRFSQEILKVKVSTTGQVDLIYTPVDGTRGVPITRAQALRVHSSRRRRRSGCFLGRPHVERLLKKGPPGEEGFDAPYTQDLNMMTVEITGRFSFILPLFEGFIKRLPHAFTVPGQNTVQ